MGKELQSEVQKLKLLRRATPVLLKRSLSSVQAEMVERIHASGRDSNGSKIGSYSTNPISVSESQQRRRTGTTYFPKGYRQYKVSVGMPPFVNLENTGQLRMDLSVIPMGAKSAGLGFKNKHNFDKSVWMEDKYRKKIYAPTKKENEILIRVFDQGVKRLIT